MLVFFICMLQVFHLDAYVYLQWLHTYFQVVFLVFFKCFKCMLQVFQPFRVFLASVSTGIAKVDRVLHILQYMRPTCRNRLSC
jgi:hypothetical protein